MPNHDASLDDLKRQPSNSSGKAFLFLLALFVLSIFISRALPTALQASLKVANGQEQAITLPYYQDSSQLSLLEFSITLHIRSPYFSKIRIFPDDCITSLTVNGASLEIPSSDACNYAKGIPIDLSSVAQVGENRLVLVIQNTLGGGHGLSISTSPSDILTSPFGILYCLVFLLFLGVLCRSWMLGPKLIFIVLGSTLLRFLYLGCTPFYLRTHDVLMPGGHFDFIEFVAQHATLPWHVSGWEYHQAPLYYIVAGALDALLGVERWNGSPIFLQLYSLLMMSLFCIFSIRSALFLNLKDPALSTFALLLCFWPSTIIHAVRLGNDPQSYAASAFALYWLLRAIASETGKQVLQSAASNALALLSKLNCLPLAIVAILFFVFQICSSARSRVQHFAAIALVLLGIVGALGRNIARLLGGSSDGIVLGSAGMELPAELFVGNSWRHFLFFDFQTFLHQPFASAWSDEYGRLYFWSYLWKTSLFGECWFPRHISKELGIVFAYLLLPILAAAAVGIVQVISSRERMKIWLLGYLLTSLLVLIAYHCKTPLSTTNDFRTILPILFPVCFFAVHSVASSHIGNRFLQALAFVWAGTSCLFFSSLL